jgi:superfamily II DNA/RNA helicase
MHFRPLTCVRFYWFSYFVERVLIFCQWKKMLNIIQRFVELQGWKFGRLDGNTNVAARQRLVDTFNADESYFGMLCTTRTGGVGLNLTGANRIILYDRKFFLSYFQARIVPKAHAFATPCVSLCSGLEPSD